MLESSSNRLTRKGGPHYGSKDKIPAIRLETIRLAGLEKIPLTSGILIGIGETRTERIESLLELRKLNEKYGHIQEIIIQNFRAKPGTKMQFANEPGINELVWTIAIARIIFGSTMNIQAPPNLYKGELPDSAIKVREHYKNLFELPTFFFLLCVILYLLDRVESIDVILAWIFVFFKILHSFVRLTTNNTRKRAYSFTICYFALLFGWILLVFKLIVY